MCSHNLRRLLAALAAMTVLLGAAGCAEQSPEAGSSAETATSSQAEEHSAAESSTEKTGEAAPSVNTQAAALPEISLSKWDTKTDWDDSAVTVTLSGSSITATSSEGLQIAGSVLTITKGGTYVLSGTLDDGRVTVNLTDSTEKVQLVLNGAQITSKSSSPLTVMQADKIVLTLATGTENALTDAAEYTEFDEEMTQTAGSLAKEFGLKQSGGSDFHGATKPGISLGTGRGSLYVPYRFYEDMLGCSTYED